MPRRTNALRFVFLSASKVSFICLCVLLLSGSSLYAQKKSSQESASLDTLLIRLKAGNERFISGRTQTKNYLLDRSENAEEQHPFAIILACSDSRVPPEIIFDESLGKLFIVRVAGNVADPVVLGSIEYAVEHLHANLLIVLGHESCGAVKATLSGGHLPPNIETLVHRIEPGLHNVSREMNEKLRLDRAVKENVRYQMQMAMFESDVLTEFVSAKKLKVVGGFYDLHTGRVEFMTTNMAIEHHEATNTFEAKATETKDKEASVATAKVQVAKVSTALPPAAPESSNANLAQEAHSVAAPTEERAAATEDKSNSFSERLRTAFENKAEVMLKKTLLLRSSTDGCTESGCRNVAAGEAVRIMNPEILNINGKPRVKIRYKGQTAYLNAEVSDFVFKP